jgi:hypothetical protein
MPSLKKSCFQNGKIPKYLENIKKDIRQTKHRGDRKENQVGVSIYVRCGDQLKI